MTRNVRDHISPAFRYTSRADIDAMVNGHGSYPPAHCIANWGGGDFGFPLHRLYVSPLGVFVLSTTNNPMGGNFSQIDGLMLEPDRTEVHDQRNPVERLVATVADERAEIDRLTARLENIQSAFIVYCEERSGDAMHALRQAVLLELPLTPAPNAPREDGR